MFHRYQFTLTIVIVILSANNASAQPWRYELGRRLRDGE